jgi:L-asparaginase II
MNEPVLVEVTRNGVVESEHRGSFVVLDPSGSVHRSAGVPGLATYPRSANKPMQAAAMVRFGLDVPDRLLALAAASHSGEPFHVAGVQEILTSAQCSPSALANATGLPLDIAAQHAWLRAGNDAAQITHNCSGKHAAMIATCLAAKWPTEGYLAFDHRLQLAITEEIEQLGHETVDGIGIDGCGAPAHRLSLVALARSFQQCAAGRVDGAPRRVGDAMRRYPEMVGGTNRDVTILMRSVPGLLAKDGAEGVFAAATHDGWSVAVKLRDGAWRGRVAVVLRLLENVGVDMDAAKAQGLSAEAVHGGSAVVGTVHVASELDMMR